MLFKIRKELNGLKKYIRILNHFHIYVNNIIIIIIIILIYKLYFII